MSITSGYNKYKRYTKLSDGTYKLVSQWTNSNTVEMDNGSTLQATLGNTSISGIGDGTVTGAIDSLNSNLTNAIKFGLYSGGDIAGNSWTTIMSFRLKAGKYMVLWSCSYPAFNNVNNLLCGTRLKNTTLNSVVYINLKYYVNNQSNGSLGMTTLSLENDNDIQIDFYQNVSTSNFYVGNRTLLVFPIDYYDYHD